uniref:Uncharacterized protein n=1 Tax=Vannella robusta TaxID=1487602 RepID=A0A7S4MK18_9EUKA
MSQSHAPVSWKVNGCCNPLSRKPIFEPNPYFEFAGAVTLCGLQSKLEDEILDDKRSWYRYSATIMKKLLHKKVNKAETFLNEQQFPVEQVRAILSQQSSVETQYNRDVSLDSVSRPTASAFGEILKHASILSNGENPNASLFHSIGSHLGHITYLIDSVQDYDKDRQRGEFNPMFHLGNETLPLNERKEQIVQDIMLPKILFHYTEIQKTVKKVHFEQYGDLIPSILGTRFLNKIKNGVEPHVTTTKDDNKEEETQKSKSSCWGDCCGNCCFMDCADPCCFCAKSASKSPTTTAGASETVGVATMTTESLGTASAESAACCDCACCDCTCCECSCCN